jgi:hypothetical protein
LFEGLEILALLKRDTLFFAFLTLVARKVRKSKAVRAILLFRVVMLLRTKKREGRKEEERISNIQY